MCVCVKALLRISGTRGLTVACTSFCLMLFFGQICKMFG
jgi:hypothetical protein